jgi:hypothetical protein
MSSVNLLYHCCPVFWSTDVVSTYLDSYHGRCYWHYILLAAILAFALPISICDENGKHAYLRRLASVFTFLFNLTLLAREFFPIFEADWHILLLLFGYLSLHFIVLTLIFFYYYKLFY